MWKNIHSPNLGFLLVIVNGLVLREHLNLNHGFSPSNMFFSAYFPFIQVWYIRDMPLRIDMRSIRHDLLRCRAANFQGFVRKFRGPWKIRGKPWVFKSFCRKKHMDFLIFGHYGFSWVTLEGDSFGPALVLWGFPQLFCWNPPKAEDLPNGSLFDPPIFWFRCPLKCSHCWKR